MVAATARRSQGKIDTQCHLMALAESCTLEPLQTRPMGSILSSGAAGDAREGRARAPGIVATFIPRESTGMALNTLGPASLLTSMVTLKSLQTLTAICSDSALSSSFRPKAGTRWARYCRQSLTMALF